MLPHGLSRAVTTFGCGPLGSEILRCVATPPVGMNYLLVEDAKQPKRVAAASRHLEELSEGEEAALCWAAAFTAPTRRQANGTARLIDQRKGG